MALQESYLRAVVRSVESVHDGGELLGRPVAGLQQDKVYCSILTSNACIALAPGATLVRAIMIPQFSAMMIMIF